MKFIRRLVFLLALVSVFIYLSIFSSIAYHPDNIDLDKQGDEFTVAAKVLNGLSNLLSYSDKISSFGFWPVSQTRVNSEILANQFSPEKMTDLVTKTDTIIDKNILKNEEKVDFLSIKQKIQERLLEDWFRP
jgi:hypothetical protein